MKNKIIAHLTIILIMVGVFCNVCTTYNRISVYNNSVYAEADNWTSCDSSDLVTAFRYYCKSRNLAIEGSLADALTTFTTSTFNNICSTLGIDTTQLQAELKKTTNGNLGLRFLFSNTGITAYNRIFAEFLQNNNLDVGDEVDNENINSGKYYSDNNGNKCFVFVLNSVTTYSEYSENVVQYGTYLVSGDTLFSSQPSSYTFNFPNNLSYTTPLTYSADNVNAGGNDRWDILKGVLYKGASYQRTFKGGFTICSNADGSVLQLCTFNQVAVGANPVFGNLTCCEPRLNLLVNADDVKNSDIYITTNNNTINNNVYNNNYTIIYNDGDTYISDDDDEPLPTTPPDGGGGGGGGDNPVNPDFPPVDPTPTPNPTIPDWDIELPEMPTGNDWLLYGLEKKFPWDIPFNLMYMLSLFAADPETPHFEGTLDLKIVQWNYDIDLAPFDDIAGYVRNIEFIGFLIGLMLLTNKLIWG